MAVLAEAKLGTMRLGAARLDFYKPLCSITLNGTRVETAAQMKTVRVSKYANSTAAVQGQLSTATIRFKANLATLLGAAPKPGLDLKIYSGSTAPQSLAFGGRVQQVEQSYDGAYTNVAYTVSAVGYGWFFNRKYIKKAYLNVSATDVIKDIVTLSASGFTSLHVEAGLPLISVNFDRVLPMDAAGQVAALIPSVRFFIDDSADFWFFTRDPRSQPETIIGLNPTNPISKAYALTVTTDESQIRTRVFVRGGAESSTSNFVVASSTVIPLTNAEPFDLAFAGLASGQVAVDTPLSGLPEDSTAITREDVISYTGTSRSGVVQAPTSVTGIVVTNINIGASGHLTNGATYQLAFSFVTSNGETAVSPTVTQTLTGGSNTAFNIALPNTGALYQFVGANTLGPLDPSITAINVYRTVANGSQLFFSQAIAVGATAWPTNITESNADTALGAPPPLVSYVSQGQSSLTTSSGAGVGDTTILNCSNLTALDAAGGYAITGEFVVRYTGFTFTLIGGNQIAGTLQLASALTANVAAGATITATPALTGCSGVPAIARGQSVTAFAQADDAAAQAAQAAIDGTGDGVYEHAMTASSIRSIAGPTAEGLAQLALYKSPEQRIEVTSRDAQIQPGTLLPVNIGAPNNIVGTYQIQETTITDFQAKSDGPPYLYPLVSARGSTVRFVLEDFLWAIKLKLDQLS